jgi:hypothetical protein
VAVGRWSTHDYAEKQGYRRIGCGRHQGGAA